MDRIEFTISFDPQHAYVDSKFSISDIVVVQNAYSWKTAAILLFVFNGRRVNIDVVTDEYGAYRYLFYIEPDGLDTEFMRIANVVPPSRYGFWRRIVKMLETKPRDEVLHWAKAKSLSLMLSK